MAAGTPAATQPTTPEEGWAGPAGNIWRANVERLEAMLDPFGQLLLERTDARPGERVLDVGCGGGATTVQLARRVTPGGEVVGADLSVPLVELARRRAEAAGVSGVARFVVEDAATTTLPEGTFDHLVSRFGVMFFSRPPEAFAHLVRRLRPGGRLTFVVWSLLERNEWMGNVRKVASRHVEVPPFVPRAPGPFALAEVGYVTGLLEAAGLSGVSTEPVARKILVGGPGNTAESAAAFLQETSTLARQSFDAAAENRDTMARDLVESMRPYQTGEGVEMPAEALVVTGRR